MQDNSKYRIDELSFCFLEVLSGRTDPGILRIVTLKMQKIKSEKRMENLKKVKETILELIYPSKCPFCGEIVSAGKKHSTEHNGICKACREKLPYIGEVRCMCCGKPLTDPEEEYCYDCTRQKHFFVDGRSLWVHKDAVENAVYAMKYQNRRIYGQTFGKEMAEHFLSYLWERKITLIVPVPLHSRRKRKRGFNQAEIVAKVLSESTGITRLFTKSCFDKS